jgi:hypothetical protein
VPFLPYFPSLQSEARVLGRKGCIYFFTDITDITYFSDSLAKPLGSPDLIA